MSEPLNHAAAFFFNQLQSETLSNQHQRWTLNSWVIVGCCDCPSGPEPSRGQRRDKKNKQQLLLSKKRPKMLPLSQNELQISSWDWDKFQGNGASAMSSCQPEVRLMLFDHEKTFLNRSHKRLIAAFSVGFGWLTRLKRESKIKQQSWKKRTKKKEIPFLSYTITKKGWSFPGGTF